MTILDGEGHLTLDENERFWCRGPPGAEAVAYAVGAVPPGRYDNGRRGDRYAAFGGMASFRRPPPSMS